MSALPDTALALLALTLLLWVTLQWLVNQSYKYLRPQILQLTASRRVGITSWLGVMPFLTTVLAVCAVLGPWPGALMLESHCHSGDPCTAHSPTGLGLDAASFLMLLAGLVLVRAAAMSVRIYRAQAQLRSLWQESHRAGFEQLDCNAPLALTVGLLRPRVFISSGLTKQLSTTELRAVLAHEQAHQRHHDNLRQSLFQLLTASALARQLRTDLHQAIEQRADQHAAGCCGGTQAMARILIRLQRLALASPPTLNSSISGADFPQRIRALLHPVPPSASTHGWPLVLLASIALLTALSTGPLHHALETIANRLM